jgi:hypothetical protein
MPTLEDTAVDFPVTTLNDLLEVEAKAGVTVVADADKYRRWAFLSTGVAGLLAIILAVVLITDGGGGGDGGGSVAKPKDYPGRPVKNTVKLTGEVPSNVKADTEVSLYKGGELIVAPAIVSQIIKPKSGSVDTSPSVELAMTDEQGNAFIKAFTKGTEKGRIQAYSPGQPTAPAATPAPAPATTDATAPAATTETTAPAATTETTAPAGTTETTAPPSG